MTLTGPTERRGPRESGALDRAWRIACEVPDPELPMLTLADLGVLRGMDRDEDGTVVVRLTPTYSGCPAMAEMRAEVATRLRAADVAVRVVTVLDPPWTTDWITPEGRRKLAEHGIAPPGPPRAPGSRTSSVRLTLGPAPDSVCCPRCAATHTEEISRFSGTACKALRRCRACLEPFEHIKDL